MAGHSKWANIQHRKKRQDAKRGKLFSRLIREVTSAARGGGGNPADNPRLRLAVERAVAANMPKENIERAVARGSGAAEGGRFEEVRYEGYGPGGTAILVECLTDNRNRTVAEVRHAFTKCGGNLGESGSVAYLFSSLGVLTYPQETDEDALLEAAMEADAEDAVRAADGSLEVLTAPQEFSGLRMVLTEAGFEPESAGVEMRPQGTQVLSVEQEEKLEALTAALEELEDVQGVYTNAAPGGDDG